MKGFRDFVLRGNLVELAVAFIIGAAFATVVTTFTDILMVALGKLGGTPDFNAWKPAGLPVGAFLTALVAFLILAAVVYFFVVKPYEAAKKLFEKEEEAAGPTSEELLGEIRDLIRDKNVL